MGAAKGLFLKSGHEGTVAPSREVAEVMTETEVVEIHTMGLLMDKQTGRYQKLSLSF